MPGARITSCEQPGRGEDRDDRTTQRTPKGQPGKVPGATAGFRQRPGNCRIPPPRAQGAGMSSEVTRFRLARVPRPSCPDGDLPSLRRIPQDITEETV